MTTASLNAGNGIRVGHVLSRAKELFGANPGFFFTITLIAALPGLLFHRAYAEAPHQIGWRLGIAFILVTILNTIAQAMILFTALEHLRGLPVQPGEAVRKSLQRFFPLLVLGIVASAAIGVGLIVLIVPGLVLLVVWAVVVPACVAENLGPIASMSRSASLTKGHRWSVFWIILPVVVSSFVVSWLLDLVLSPLGSLVAGIAGLVWTAAWFAYWNCVLVVIYHDLRVTKEATDIHQIAAQAGN